MISFSVRRIMITSSDFRQLHKPYNTLFRKLSLDKNIIKKNMKINCNGVAKAKVKAENSEKRVFSFSFF